MNYLRLMSNRYCIVMALFLVAIIAAASCGSPAVNAPGEQGSDTASLTQDALRNAEYQGIYQEAVRLTDGKYEGEPFVEGGASRPTVTFTDAYVFGDLDGDGVDDAAVVLVESSGGSGSFLYLAAVLNQDGNPENVATRFVGDRGQFQAISVTKGQIDVKMITHGPDDPMCCPTQIVRNSYALEDGALVEVASKVLETVELPGESTTKAPAELTLEALHNASYPSEWEESGVITLTDGRYEGEPYVEGGASRLVVTLVGPVAFGDLDGDGVEDAAVVLAANPGGSGTFYSLEAVRNGEGDPVHVATHSLGDRVQVESLAIEDGQIVLKMVTHGPDDPMCCPTKEVTLEYRLEGEQLVKESVEGEEPAISLTGTCWILVSYRNDQGETVDVLPNSEITAEFTADQVAGSAGCNNYFASYQVNDSTVTIGPVGATRMACAEPDGIMEQEYDYLAALESAATYQIAGDELALTGADGALIATFAKATGSHIVGVMWKWARFDDMADDNHVVVDDPDKYTFKLLPDGTYQVKADCNLSGGGYTLAGKSLTLLPGPTTLAECGPGSLYDEYLARLGDVESFVLDGDRLVLNLKADAARMSFVRGEDSTTGLESALVASR